MDKPGGREASAATHFSGQAASGRASKRTDAHLPASMYSWTFARVCLDVAFSCSGICRHSSAAAGWPLEVRDSPQSHVNLATGSTRKSPLRCLTVLSSE